MKLSVIIPVYSEEKTILTIIDRVKSVPLPDNIEKEIIIVDDGSKDSTKSKLMALPEEPAIRIFYQDKNQGKTAAVRLGLAKVTGDFIIIQDADLEYSPEYYPALLQPILDNQASIVYGSRFMGKIRDMEFINWLANKISILTINGLFHTHITDFYTGFKMFKKETLNNIEIKSNDFSFEPEITAKFILNGYTIHEIPIEYRARSRAEGKKITWGKALKAYFVLLKLKLSPKR